jgi:hypothetical protein
MPFLILIIRSLFLFLGFAGQLAAAMVLKRTNMTMKQVNYSSGKQLTCGSSERSGGDRGPPRGAGRKDGTLPVQDSERLR